MVLELLSSPRRTGFQYNRGRTFIHLYLLTERMIQLQALLKESLIRTKHVENAAAIGINEREVCASTSGFYVRDGSEPRGEPGSSGAGRGLCWSYNGASGYPWDAQKDVFGRLANTAPP